MIFCIAFVLSSIGVSFSVHFKIQSFCCSWGFWCAFKASSSWNVFSSLCSTVFFLWFKIWCKLYNAFCERIVRHQTFHMDTKPAPQSGFITSDGFQLLWFILEVTSQSEWFLAILPQIKTSFANVTYSFSICYQPVIQNLLPMDCKRQVCLSFQPIQGARKSILPWTHYLAYTSILWLSTLCYLLLLSEYCQLHTLALLSNNSFC